MRAWVQVTRPYLRYRGRLDDGDLIYGCTYLQPDNRCGIYDKRPEICRLYPHHRRWLRAPRLFEECSYEVRPVREPLAELPILRLPEPPLAGLEAEGQSHGPASASDTSGRE